MRMPAAILDQLMLSSRKRATSRLALVRNFHDQACGGMIENADSNCIAWRQLWNEGDCYSSRIGSVHDHRTEKNKIVPTAPGFGATAVGAHKNSSRKPLHVLPYQSATENK